MNVNREWLKFLREQYPVGSRIRLREMKDPYNPVPPGTMGTLKAIDDIGTFHVAWDNGSGLGVIMGEDSFTVLPPETHTLKLYMPLTANLYERNEWGDMESEPVELDAHSVAAHEGSILAAMVRNRAPEERERGLMHWYHEEDSINAKVQSAEFSVENVDGRLWGIVNCRIKGELMPEELETFKEYVEGQAADGWGEGFEQREIKTDAGELYVHLWNSSDSWRLCTEDELSTTKLFDELPELCFSVLPSDGALICLKRGESGYFLSDWSTDSREKNQELADYNNERLGVTKAQRQAMECGSMHGWEVPGADPTQYEREGEINQCQTM